MSPNPDCVKLEQEGRYDKAAECHERNNDAENAKMCWALSAKQLESEGICLDLAQDHYARAGMLGDLRRVAEKNYRGDFENVIRAIECAEKQLRRDKNPLAADACTLAGKIYLEHGKEYDAKRKFCEASIRYSKFVPQNEVKENLESAFRNLMQDNRHKTSLENARMALNLAKKLGKVDLLEELNESVCEFAAESGDMDAIPCLDELAEIYSKSKRYGKLAESLEKLVKIHPKGYDCEGVWKRIAEAWWEAGNMGKFEDAAINANIRPYAVETGEGVGLTKKQLLEMMENPDAHLFITGPAGSGKTTLIREFVKKTGKSCAIVAFTGIAAINVGGQTIHSFFRINPFNMSEIRNDLDDAARKSFTNLEVIIIDEISMVSRELFDEIDRRMRYYKSGLRPFGGCKVIMIGDYFQLPPVPKENERIEHVFESIKYGVLNPKNIRLLSNYRQKDGGFLKILNSVRLRDAGFGGALDKLNANVDQEFYKKGQENCILLTTTNEHAKRINNMRLDDVFGREAVYKADWNGAFANDVNAGKSLPADLELRLKNGARVMFIRNDPEGRWVNGSLGTVRNAAATSLEVVLDENKTPMEVPKMKFEKIKQEFDISKGRIEPKTIGEFIQYPLRLAWAITIHKSQGQTFDSVYLDFGDMRPFAHGQTYVALSRCRTLEGLKLAQKITEQDVISEPRIMRYLQENRLI